MHLFDVLPQNLIKGMNLFLYSQLARTQSQMTKKREELVAARSEYNREYRMSYDINLPDNGPYEKELNELKAIKLPEYMEKIKDAKEKAYQQIRSYGR